MLTCLYHRNAGWSSLVARWAHNPKVGGSNPPPATNAIMGLPEILKEHPRPKSERPPKAAFLLARNPVKLCGQRYEMLFVRRLRRIIDLVSAAT